MFLKLSMAESVVTETKKQVINPRVEIDTNPPFESVKEAVDHFGGGGRWFPGQNLLRLTADQNGGDEVFDMDKVEEQAALLERDLIMKEQETLHVLKELEAAKRFVEGLKENLVQEVSAFGESPDLKEEIQNSAERLTLCPAMSPGFISMELNQAKMNLSKTTTNLALIRESVETLNKKMRAEKILLERINDERKTPNSSLAMRFEKNYHECRDRDHFVQATVNSTTESPMISNMISAKELQELNFEDEQFKKMTEASRYEVMKAMLEIERTKTSIKMAEMRLTAARKMEEAAKAVEAIAIAERDTHQLDCMSSPEMFLHKSAGVTLSFEEYTALTHKAQQAEELCKTKFIDSNATDRRNQSEVAIVKKLETTTTTSKESRRSKKSLEQALDNEDRLDRRNLGFNDESSQETTPAGNEKIVHSTEQNAAGKYRFRNSNPSGHRRSTQPLNGSESEDGKDKSVPVYRSTISIGDILSRKLILQDDYVVGKHVDSHDERQEVSLSQMLREQSGLILNPTKSMKDGSVVDKQYYSQRKKFGFIHVTIPRQIKKKTQVLNPR